MSKRINLNPKGLEKKEKSKYENKIIVGIFILCIVGMIGWIGNGILENRNSYLEKQKLETEVNGLNFSSSNAKLNKEIKEKQSEVDFLSSLKNQKNYYTLVEGLTNYVPQGINLTTVQAMNGTIKISGETGNKNLIPVFLENLKGSNLYKEAFLQDMQSINTIENIKNTKSTKSTEKPKNLKKVEKTIFSIEVGGDLSEKEK